MTQVSPAILCIDDDAAFRQTVSTRLTEEGFHVTAVATGREGIVATWTERFDVILLDMCLPNQEGLNTYQTLRTNAATQQIPAILLTDLAGESWWEALPYATNSPCFVMGRSTDWALLAVRINQLLAGVGSVSGRSR